MRKAKNRKQAKKLAATNRKQQIKDLKTKKIEIKKKYEVWLNLPREEWTEARRIKNPE